MLQESPNQKETYYVSKLQELRYKEILHQKNIYKHREILSNVIIQTNKGAENSNGRDQN